MLLNPPIHPPPPRVAELSRGNPLVTKKYKIAFIDFHMELFLELIFILAIPVNNISKDWTVEEEMKEMIWFRHGNLFGQKLSESSQLNCCCGLSLKSQIFVTITTSLAYQLLITDKDMTLYTPTG